VRDQQVNAPRGLPPAPPGQNYLIILMDAELVAKAIEVQGHWQDELTAALERTVREFIETRPIALYVPR
jgi:hypothetical protein